MYIAYNKITQVIELDKFITSCRIVVVLNQSFTPYVTYSVKVSYHTTRDQLWKSSKGHSDWFMNSSQCRLVMIVCKKLDMSVHESLEIVLFKLQIKIQILQISQISHHLFLSDSTLCISIHSAKLLIRPKVYLFLQFDDDRLLKLIA